MKTDFLCCNEIEVTGKMALTHTHIPETIFNLSSNFAGRVGDPEYDENKKNQIHRRNRAFVWSPSMVACLLDSILKGYPIGSITFIQQVVNGQIKRFAIDGGHRLTTFKRILNNEVRTLTETERATVMSYSIPILVIENATTSQQIDMFRRLNKSVSVTPGQLFEMSETDSTLVQEALAFLNADDYPLRAKITEHFTDTRNEADSKGRTVLANTVVLISCALYGVYHANKSFEYHEDVLNTPIDNSKLQNMLGLLFAVYERANQIFPITDKRKLKAQRPMGRFNGAILYDLHTQPQNILDVIEKWGRFIAMYREGNPFAIDALDIAGAQNLTPHRLKKISSNVASLLNHMRLLTKEELKVIYHDDNETVYDDESDHDTNEEED